MVLSDELVLLRAIELDDADILHSLINDSEIEASVCGWSFPVSMEAQKRWISNLSNSNTIRYSIVTNNEVVGMASISDLDFKNRVANLNIKLISEARGKGIAYHCIRLLIDYCFNELNLNCLTAGVIENNEASKALWTKLGFSVDGILRQRLYKNGKYHNVVSYSLLKDELDGNR